MKESNIFSIENFNVIQDEENYYVFRALNNGDHNDIENNITANENGINRIRTDRERWSEERGHAKYYEQSQISLEEVWDHIKIRYSKETNCISLSSNANVTIDYGQGYNEEYVMVKVPKEGNEKIYDAGRYMLDEVAKRVEEKLKDSPSDSEILKIINQIDNSDSYAEVARIIADSYDAIENKSEDMKQRTSFIARLDKKQYFSDEQQLQYNKIIAKVTILEMFGIERSILDNKSDNSSLIATIGMAFSSGELIHYKDIQAEEMQPISKEMMNSLALIQQMKENEKYREKAIDLEKEILEYINQGYDFSKNGDQLEFTNGINSIDIKDTSEIDETKDDNLSINDVYQLTKGRVAYQKAKSAVDFAYKLSRARKDAIKYSGILRTIVNNNPEFEEVIQAIEEHGVVIDKDIINREDQKGVKIAESVSLGMDRERTSLVSNEEQIKIITAIQKLEEEKLEDIVSSRGLNLENDIIDNILEQKEEISENRYYAEAIVDALNFSKIYKDSLQERIITEDEREILINKLEKADCKRLYNAFVKAGVSETITSQYIINLLMEDGYKGYNFEELSNTEDLDEIVSKNLQYLNKRVQPLRMDSLMGIEDDSYVVDGTEIKLRDYQYDALQNIDKIFEEKRFASMVLPTGAGKSFVAISEMMRFRNSNIVFVAPQKEILSQFQRHIIKHVLKRDDVPLKDSSKVIKEVFPHLQMFCYDTIGERDEKWIASLNADLIIMDELHRSGAQTWEPKIKKMIELNPESKILGMTATPIRDVDHKDMARGIAEMVGDYTTQELNEKKYLASEMYLLDAIRDGIVVAPKIVTFDYTLGESDEYQEVKKMIAEEQDPNKKEDLTKIYNRMTEIIKDSEKIGMSGIIEENLKDKSGRYIVFLPNNPNADEISAEEYMLAEIERIKADFKEIDDAPETGFLLSNRKEKKDNVIALDKFESSKSEHLKLLFAINMLNEGVHVDRIKGSFMRRRIHENSKILYLQQIGRCIFSIDPNNPISDDDIPIIFDIYNNYLLQNLDREANKGNTTSDLQRLQSIVNWVNKHKGHFPDINSEDLTEARKAVTLKKIQEKYSRYLDGIENKNFSESEKYEINRILELAKSIELWEIEISDRKIPPGERDIVRNNTFKATGTQREFMDLFKQAQRLEKGRKMSLGLRLRTTLEVLDILAEYGVEINNETIKREDKLEKILAELSPEIKKSIMEELSVDGDFEIGEEYNNAKYAFYKGNKIFTQYDVRDLRKYGIFESFVNENYINHSSVYAGEKMSEFIERGPEEFRGINIKTGTFYNEEGWGLENIREEKFDLDGWYYEQGKNGRYVRTTSKHDDLGFTYHGEISTYGFDRKGWYYEKQADGTYKNTGLKHNPDGFRMDLTHKDTGIKLNLNDFDINGYWHEKQEDGTYKKRGLVDKYGFTFRKDISRYGFDREGWYYERQEDGTYKNTGLKYNPDGFRMDLTHKDTGTKLNQDHFDIEGDWYEKQEDGTYKRTGKADKKRDRDGFDIKGLDKKGNRKGGIIIRGKLDRHNFDDLGDFYEEREDGEYVIRSTAKRYVKKGKLNNYSFDKNGWYYEKKEDGEYVNTERKYNNYGFDINKKHKDTRTKYDEHDFDFDGINQKTKTRLNKENYDRDGYYYEQQEDGSYRNTGKKYDNHGFDIDNIHKDTGTKLNPKNFDKDGYYYIQNAAGRYLKTELKTDPDGYNIDDIDSKGFRRGENGINKYGFDREGWYYEIQEDGSYENTGVKYNPAGFTVSKKHVVTKSRVDLRRFDIDGINMDTGTIYDENGFKQDGTYLETGEKYHNGYNAWGVDKEGKTPKGTRHYDIVFVEKYLDAIMTGRRDEILKIYKMQDDGYNRAKIDIMMARACEMDPRVKFTLTNNIVLTRRNIKKREEKIKELEVSKTAKREEIAKLKREQDILRRRINYMDYKSDIDR